MADARGASRLLFVDNITALLLHAVPLNAIAKALLLTAIAAIGSFAVSAFVLRKSPLRAMV